ncbi:MAG: MBL fold metallo-hydrolase [Omnitrophica bacterium RIFCSPLOWO2_12_FULL_44_17]|uniref:MBL fold metallo-hydrolase n=1 Tax=Candidatus Danuiimicrobium aquiferis TaxID=1801832 RepID=A0A1G1KXD1_9BACT|nr:MAG: MBL fold metallo-hydrolase [Omnitrophica bacterium RIFCSPHIGHO2_02_FULL_45_28]OGW89146.1 MAG: MBL fold metallo-hydrolase [Omnitrophica bacterium RIFCSPHIGHO2_12_FULL_44_12]OGW97525.1 MAG: MBL fold metallo-hydrolase [Omnitrophica bacterium RIFCSPLOWO2_12_FULL_44_17]OGX02078.1 MAG: MBL fold metallo-hydrolase [Omnitrophica bacterium RIFCSPLOWO2_02_FULL_44_11]
MNESLPFQAVKISEHVYWVGAIDWNLRDFHGYATERGTTYNAFLILADKVTLIDTVKKPFKDEMLSRIRSVIDPLKIEYIVSNHSEMDHSGCLPEIIDFLKPKKVFASVRGEKALSGHFRFKDQITPLKTGENIPLGNMNLSVVETPMLHWPDSMFTFLDSDGVLFSQDGFGMHLATVERFADELPSELLEYEEKKYYANIILPYSKMVLSTLESFTKLNFPVKIVAPDHGPVWRQGWQKLFELYKKWAMQKPAKKAVIVYDTMWESTDKMARAISEGIASVGILTRMMPLKGSHRSNIATEVLDAGALIVGSPTLNDNLYPTVADCMTYLKGLKPQNLIGAVFGSYGWNPAAVEQLKELLKAMNVELVGEGVKVRYVPDDEALMECRNLGKQVGARLKEIC